MKGSPGTGLPFWPRGERAAGLGPGGLLVTAVTAHSKARRRVLASLSFPTRSRKDAWEAPTARAPRPAREITCGAETQEVPAPTSRPEETPLSWAVIGLTPAGDAQAQPPGLCALRPASGQAVGGGGEEAAEKRADLVSSR